jgi:hypothetical protein
LNSPRKFNPFKPNGVVHPGMFVGRLEELVLIENFLFQATHGNPQHFLVQGERGIGKSSLLLFVEHLSRGGANNHGFDFLTVSIDLGGCQTQLDIVRKIARGLKSTIQEKEALKKSAKDLWAWLTNWEILGVKYNKPQFEVDVEEVVEVLVGEISLFCESPAAGDGLLFLIDEADRPPTEANLGEFMKLATERLAKKSTSKVLFGLAGIPSVMTKLRDSHESSPRAFHSILLEPLEPAERKRVIELGMKEANDRSPQKIDITSDAITLLADLSEGYPHFVQQFAYSAFDQDIDNRIDDSDVAEGAFKSGGALSQLGDKYFNEMYHARISSEDYRRVLDAMAAHGDAWLQRQQIIKESEVAETNVNNALKALKEKSIIIQDDKRRGYYRLPTNSFAAWINAVRAARAKSDGHAEPF